MAETITKLTEKNAQTLPSVGHPLRPFLALLWQIYSRRCQLQIHFWQSGQRCFGGWAISSRMACRTAGKVG